jgi:hypothetical protein
MLYFNHNNTEDRQMANIEDIVTGELSPLADPVVEEIYKDEKLGHLKNCRTDNKELLQPIHFVYHCRQLKDF